VQQPASLRAVWLSGNVHGKPVCYSSSDSCIARDLNTLVKKEQVVSSENLTTLFVVVSKYGLKEWGTTYESLSDFVVCLDCLPMVH
jgi:hypothetical protein